MVSKIVTVDSNLFKKCHTKSIRFKFYFSGRNAKDFGLFLPILNYFFFISTMPYSSSCTSIDYLSYLLGALFFVTNCKSCKRLPNTSSLAKSKKSSSSWSMRKTIK